MSFQYFLKCWEKHLNIYMTSYIVPNLYTNKAKRAIYDEPPAIYVYCVYYNYVAYLALAVKRFSKALERNPSLFLNIWMSIL